MKLFNHPLNENDLIAYHLQELSPRRQRSLRRILQQNAALAAESEAIAATLRAFPKQEAALPVDAATRERTWLALLPSLTSHLPKPAAPFSRLRRWSLPALAGTAFAATALLTMLHHNRHAQLPTVATVATIHPSPAATPPPSTNSSLALSSGARLEAFHSRVQIGRHERSFLSAPIETEIAKNSIPIFPAAPTVPLTPTKPSSEAAGRTSTEGTTSPLSNPAQSQASAPSSAQPTIPPTAQPATPRGKSRRTFTPHGVPPTELTLGMFGNITVGRSSSYTSVFGTSQITQTATPAVGALASFRQQLRPWLGYRLTTTYFSPSFNYFNGLDIRDRIYEVSATYVAQGPHHRRLTTSVEAGASVLNFRYRDDYISPTPATTYSTYRAAAVVGVGAEFAISRHWGLRAEYRALVYRPPYVANPGDTSIAPTTSLTLSSNPILGITYRFGASGAD